MKKIVLSVIILISIIFLFLIIFNISLTNFAIKTNENNKISFDYSWTKAICEDNKCRDFEIKCLSGELIEMTPISGEVIFDDNWRDLRDEEEREKFC